MNPNPPVDPEKVRQVLLLVREQVATALWLSAGMICAVASIACTATGCRRASLAFGLFYSASLCFVHNGHAQILGPIGCAASLLGFVWPKRTPSP